jgi:hypothetical protein
MSDEKIEFGHMTSLVRVIQLKGGPGWQGGNVLMISSG